MKFWIFILLIFFLASCKAPCRKDSDIKRNYVNQDLKDFFIFKKGSYWVYENQDKTKTDSIYVSDYRSTWTPIDNILCKQNENIFYIWKSTGKHFLNQDSVKFKAEFHFLKLETGQRLIFDSLSSFVITNKLPDAQTEFPRLMSQNFELTQGIILNGTQYEGGIYRYLKNTRGLDLILKSQIGFLGWISHKDTFNLTKYYISR